MYSTGTNTNGGLLETMNLGVYGYHETAGNRNSRNVQHPSLNHGQHIHNHPSTVVQRIRGQNFQYYPQVTAASYGFPLNSSYGTMNPHSLDIGRRQQGPVAPTSHGLHRLPRVNVAADTTNRHHNLPQLRFLQADVMFFSPYTNFFFLIVYVLLLVIMLSHYKMSKLVFAGSCITGNSRLI